MDYSSEHTHAPRPAHASNAWHSQLLLWVSKTPRRVGPHISQQAAAVYPPSTCSRCTHHDHWRPVLKRSSRGSSPPLRVPLADEIVRTRSQSSKMAGRLGEARMRHSCRSYFAPQEITFTGILRKQTSVLGTHR